MDKLIEALKQIQQMSDPGSPELAVIRMKAIADKAIYDHSLTSPTPASDGVEFAEWLGKNDWKYNKPSNVWFTTAGFEFIPTTALYTLFTQTKSKDR